VEASFGSGDAALIGALLLFSGLALLSLGRLLAERIFPAPRVLFVRWGFTHVVAACLVFLFAVLLAGALLGGESILSLLIVGVLAFTLTALFIARVAHRTEPQPAESMGLRGAPLMRSAGLGLGLYILFLPAILGAGMLSPWLVERCGGVAEGQEVLLKIGDLADFELIMALVVAVALQPFLEEFLFRGFLQPLLVQNFRERGGVVLTSLLFGAIHGPVAFLPVFCLSMLLGAVYLRTRSLVAVCLIHATHNGLVLGLFLGSAEWRELSGATALIGS
jgi:membrane protease YdiL (CAAX protease family)